MGFIRHHGLLRCIILAMVAAAVAIEDFREHFTIRLTHSHAVANDGEHCHPEIFGDFESKVEFPALPLDQPSEKHVHIVRLGHDLPAAESHSKAVAVVAPPSRRTKVEMTALHGPDRRVTSLFRPPC